MQTPEQVATGDLLVVATSPTRGARIVTAMAVKVKTHATYRVAKVGASAGHAKSARRMATVSGTGDGTDTETESDETATIPATAASGNATRSVTVNETVTGMRIGTATATETVTVTAEMRRTVNASLAESVSPQDVPVRRPTPRRPTTAGCPTSLTWVATEGTIRSASGGVAETTRYVAFSPKLTRIAHVLNKADRSSKRSNRKDHHEDRSRRPSDKDGHDRSGRDSDRRRKDRDGDGDGKGLSIDTKVSQLAVACCACERLTFFWPSSSVRSDLQKARPPRRRSPLRLHRRPEP